MLKSGTIDVPELFSIEKYDTVFQMTSTVCGRLQDDIQFDRYDASALSLWFYYRCTKNKYNAIYSSVGGHAKIHLLWNNWLITSNQRMIFNIPIRTIEYNHEEAVYGVGAGITIDSVPENEVQEFHDKTKILERL